MNAEGNWLPRLEGKRLLVFDFDGTVADTSPLHAAAFLQVLNPLGVEVDYPSIAGLKTADAMHACLASAGLVLPLLDIEGLVLAKQTEVRKLIGRELRPLPGVDQFLRWASGRYQLAMVTSGSRVTVTMALKALGYSDMFSPLICAEDVSRSKPDPEGFLLALEIAGIAATEALVFEDSDAGVKAAALAKIECLDVRSEPFAEPGDHGVVGRE